ncbi:MAG: histidinol-phosphate transaminase [Oscillospiraceae bacterium]|nr:histidinol-phosphate transaminase [Oscillospiraceae bacterium]
MSRFFTERYASLVPYIPGEQPQDMQYVKLNTNESPFPPSPGVVEAAAREAGNCRLYSDPESRLVSEAFAASLGLKREQVLACNGSDETLNFAFMAFGRELAFPDISYGFYPVFAELNHIPYTEIPLRKDLSLAPEDYYGLHKMIVLANPNAPTGMALKRDEIEAIVKANPDEVVLIDEAYVDFGAESAVGLIEKYDNLLIAQTFSKFRSLAGARLGFAIGDAALIRDLNTIKYATNPYNVNRMTSAAGIAALEEDAYYRANARTIQANRRFTTDALRALGFEVPESSSNFVFARRPGLSGETLYRELKKRGVLVRHFSKPRIDDYVRVTIGTREQMDIFLRETETVIKEVLV